MIVKQLSAFVENKAGRLAEIAEQLAKAEIDVSALSLADSTDYGIVRMIVSDPEKAAATLKASGVICKITDVLAVAMDDAPGGFARVLHLLKNQSHEIKYMYACISRHEGKALMIFSVDKPEEAEALIAGTSAGEIDPKEIYRI